MVLQYIRDFNSAEQFYSFALHDSVRDVDLLTPMTMIKSSTISDLPTAIFKKLDVYSSLAVQTVIVIQNGEVPISLPLSLNGTALGTFTIECASELVTAIQGSLVSTAGGQRHGFDFNLPVSPESSFAIYAPNLQALAGGWFVWPGNYLFTIAGSGKQTP